MRFFYFIEDKQLKFKELLSGFFLGAGGLLKETILRIVFEAEQWTWSEGILFNFTTISISWTLKCVDAQANLTSPAEDACVRRDQQKAMMVAGYLSLTEASWTKASLVGYQLCTHKTQCRNMYMQKNSERWLGFTVTLAWKMSPTVHCVFTSRRMQVLYPVRVTVVE